MKLAALVLGVFSAFVITAAAFGIGGGPLMAADVIVTQRGTLNGPKSPGYLTFNLPSGCTQIGKPSTNDDGSINLPCTDVQGNAHTIVIHHPNHTQGATVEVDPQGR